MSDRCSLGVVIPTRNSASLLPAHLAALRSWSDLADQVVVVDSFSTDGTLEILRRELRQPGVEFVTHPPGLYASWNFGIERVRSEYVYLSTMGDTITREGLQQLLATAQSLRCDVVISKPSFRDLHGRPARIEWPIDDIIRTLHIKRPCALQPLAALVFAIVHAGGALTGSCASDLFRTDCLKRFPFPTDFGTAGDGFWGLMHAAEVLWGVEPRTFSRFLLHPTNASAEEREAYDRAPRANEVLCGAIHAWKATGVLTDDQLASIGWEELLAAGASYLEAKRTFDQHRRARLPWLVNPAAWQARLQRQRALVRLQGLKKRGLAAHGLGGVQARQGVLGT